MLQGRAMTLALEFVRKHPVVEYEGHRMLLDTGSPATLHGGPITERVVQELGTHLDGILGMDTLGTRPFVLDYPEKSLAIGAPLQGCGMPLDSCFGVPIVDIGVGRAILDTGAVISYAPREAVRGLDTFGETLDFHPFLPEPFTTSLYRVPLALAGKNLELVCGVLPANFFELTRQMSDCSWILGHDLFAQGEFGLDMPARRLAVSWNSGTEAQ